MATLNQLTRTGKRAYRRVGRGQSSTRGKQSGRGGKGQTARAGNKRRPEWRDIIKKLPKRRGYGKNRGRTVDGTRLDAFVLPLTRIDALFENGTEVSLKTLIEKGVIHARKMQPIKIVGGEDFSKKLSFAGVSVTTSARAAIEKAGGSIVLPVAPAPRARTQKPVRAPKKK